MKRPLTLAVLVCSAGLITGLVYAITVDHWLFHPLTGRGYLFSSGVEGTALFSTGIYTGLATWYLHRNCRHKGCPWLGHPHPGHGQPMCAKHMHKTPHGLQRHHGLAPLWKDVANDHRRNLGIGSGQRQS